MFFGTNRRAIVAAAAAVTAVLLGSSSALADEQVISLLTFEDVTPFSGQPNTGSLGVEGVFFFTYSGTGGNGATFTRVEGVDTDGNGGGNALFSTYDGSNSAPAFYFYAGLGKFYYVDPAIGLPVSTADKIKLTMDIKATGLIGDPPHTSIRFTTQKDGGGGDSYIGLLPLALSDTYQNVGGTLDTFFPQDVDPDGAGPLPTGPSVYNGRNSFQFQLDFGNGAFGFDNDNKLSIDNVRLAVIRPVYKGAATASYNDTTSWGEDVPNSVTSFPLFGPNGGAARTVSVDSAVTVNRLDFTGAIDDAVTFNGAGSFTIQGDSPGAIDHSGNDSIVTVNVPVVLAKNGRFRVNAGNALLDLASGMTGTGNIIKDRNGRMRVKHVRTNGSLTIAGGIFELQGGIGNESTSVVNALSVSATEASANLRLNDARLIVDYTGTSPLAATVASVVAGDITVAFEAPANQTVAVVERSQLPAGFGGTFGGQPADSTSLLLLSTLRGDANIDRSVNFADLVLLAQNYNKVSGAGWEDGDFNYDTNVNFADLVALAQNYNGTFTAAQADAVGSSFAAEFALAQTMVPEPTTAAALAVIGVIGLGRRRAK